MAYTWFPAVKANGARLASPRGRGVLRLEGVLQVQVLGRLPISTRDRLDAVVRWSGSIRWPVRGKELRIQRMVDSDSDQ